MPANEPVRTLDSMIETAHNLLASVVDFSEQVGQLAAGSGASCGASRRRWQARTGRAVGGRPAEWAVADEVGANASRGSCVTPPLPVRTAGGRLGADFL